MRRELKYSIEDSTIANLLGIQNFTNDESAILELVKNAYDASASFLKITFDKDSIVLEDNGRGMSSDDIERKWMKVGSSSKGYSVVDQNNQARVLAGSKGIGRFALARLGASVILLSQKEGEHPICWTTDWQTSNVEKIDKVLKNGTTIVIQQLRESWNKYKVKNLISFLSKTYNDTKMSITVLHDGIEEKITSNYHDIVLGVDCLSLINLTYCSENQSLIVKIRSDEFSDEAQKFCSNVSIKDFEQTINMVDELLDSYSADLNEIDLKQKLKNLGDFTAELYFSIKTTLKDKEKFLYKHSMLQNTLSSGIALYRNAFSISSLEGGKDWLGLGRRSRKSPAAASHPTGAWRVRDNQICGKVLIDKKKNAVLEDLSNRQGLNENIYFMLFVDVIHTALQIFERYRQLIIRSINTKNPSPINIPANNKLLYKVANGIISVKELSDTDERNFSIQLKTLLNTNKQLTEDVRIIEAQYHYEVRLLNVLATMGLKAFSAAHELKNQRNFITANVECIRNALKKYGMWDSLNSAERTKSMISNVPKLLEKNEDINAILAKFMNAVLTKIEKRKFLTNDLNINQVMIDIKESWENDYRQINVTLKVDQELKFKTSEDILIVIFDNLILNTIQQNEKAEKINISIDIKNENGCLNCVYQDNGKGLAKKYQNNPRLILEVHESTRSDGHGLGMWIINNTCESSGGHVLDIAGTNGFLIRFTIGDKI